MRTETKGPWNGYRMCFGTCRWVAAVAISASPASRVRADSTWEYAVRLSATVQESPPRITLNWLQDTIATPQSYTVYRKDLNDTSWGAGTVLSGTTTAFIDSAVAIGQAYEYQIRKIASGYEGYGYLYSGIDVPMVENRGTVLLIVDSTYAADLAAELAQLQQDLVGDGWNVIRQDFGRNAAVTDVKAFIAGAYNADPANVNTVFLFGHVPVPYSGNLNPDEHPDHKGAWPADVYYGNLAGPWTDTSVNTTTASDPRNWNVPGDGKFDQSTLTSLVKLMVGRVDLANMPGQQTLNGPPTFPGEPELLRNYLSKDHNFRFGLMNLPRRGLLSDFFGDASGEAYSASGWRNFSAFLGPENITYLPGQGAWLSALSSTPFLWAYGSGSGVRNAINGLGFSPPYNEATTTDLVAADPQAAFYMVLGSWLGDWDTQDDFMRAVLATPSYGLTCCWSGMPHWFCQHMALGETIGWSTRRTQNNATNSLYLNEVNAYARMTHVALMGDPTLRMHPVIPPSNLSWGLSAGATVLTWTASPDTVLGYHIYRATNPAGPFTRLTDSVVPGTSFSDNTAPAGTYTYMVRALKLENTPSGSYYNLSQGIFLTFSGLGQGVHVNAILVNPTGVALSWAATPGAVYHVLYSNDLTSNRWEDLSPDITAATNAVTWTDYTAPASRQRFYRVFQVQ